MHCTNANGSEVRLIFTKKLYINSSLVVISSTKYIVFLDPCETCNLSCEPYCIHRKIRFHGNLLSPCKSEKKVSIREFSSSPTEKKIILDPMLCTKHQTKIMVQCVRIIMLEIIVDCCFKTIIIGILVFIH